MVVLLMGLSILKFMTIMEISKYLHELYSLLDFHFSAPKSVLTYLYLFIGIQIEKCAFLSISFVWVLKVYSDK